MSEHPGRDDTAAQGPAEAGEELLPPAPPWLTELLASLPEDDPPIPEHVAARLDAALAVLTPSRPGADRPTQAAGGSPAAVVDRSSGAPATDATVVPLAVRSRRRDRPAGGSRVGHRLLLGGVAAAAVVILGGLSTVAVLRGSHAGGQGPVTVANGPAPTTGAATSYVATTEGYTAANLATGAQTLLAQTGHAGSTGPSAPATPLPSPLVADSTPASVRPAPGCLSELTGSTTVAALVVDVTTYEHTPVFVVLSPTLNTSTQAVDPGSVDIWVVRRTCSAADAAVITFLRVAR